MNAGGACLPPAGKLVTLDINSLVSIPEIHGTSGIYAPPDDRIVNRVHALQILFVKGQKKVGFFGETRAPSKVESYAENHIASQ